MRRVQALMVMVLLGLQTLLVEAWDGPRSGPVAQPNKKIIFIASDLNNGGVLGVKNGFMEAVRTLAWEVEVKDGGGSISEIQKLLRVALNAKVDGIVLGGFQPDFIPESLNRAKRPVLIGWHAGSNPKHSKVLFANITTDPVEVAKMAVESLQLFGSKNPGVVVLTDKQFAIANEKVRYVSDYIKKCKSCKLLAIENVPIKRAQHEVPVLVVRLNQRFGKKWTHTIAINDIYFDNMNFPLKEVGRTDITNIAAGDGSSVAFGRIKSGGSQQVMTIAEPLLAQGWQIADEFNRAFAGKNESGFVTKPMAVTKKVLEKIPDGDVGGHLGFREAYSNIWKRP